MRTERGAHYRGRHAPQALTHHCRTHSLHFQWAAQGNVAEPGCSALWVWTDPETPSDSQLTLKFVATSFLSEATPVGSARLDRWVLAFAGMHCCTCV